MRDREMGECHELTSVLSSCTLREFFSELSASSVVCFWMRLSVSSWSRASSSEWLWGERGVAGTWQREEGRGGDEESIECCLRKT